MTENALRTSSALVHTSDAPLAKSNATNTLSSRTQRQQRSPTSQKLRSVRSRLKVVPRDLEPIDSLMIHYGQFECGPRSQPIRPIVPRCMTALPENLTEFLESLLPSGY